jgi:hypothetical protein
MNFSIEATQPLLMLHAGATDITVVVDACVSGSGQGGSAPTAEVIVIDCSSSMIADRKIDQAKTATLAAIDCIRDGVAFAVIAGTMTADQVYPERGLATASDSTRAAARAAVPRLRADGGTAIGSWLRAAGALFHDRPDTICHAILLTDGQNVGESAAGLAAAIESVRGVFQCDCRGVGTDWDADELRAIAQALLGDADIVARPADLTADFTKLVKATMGRAVPRLRLRLWTPDRVTLLSLEQAHPTVEELRPSPDRASPREVDFPIGDWGDECRSYLISLRTTAGDLTDPPMLAARLSLVEGDTVRARTMIQAAWTSDLARVTDLSPEAVTYTKQGELSRAVQEGLAAERMGDTRTAEAKLGRAWRLAKETGHQDTLDLIESVVEVDTATSSVRLKGDVSEEDRLTLDIRSTRTTPRKVDPDPGRAD